MASLTIGQIIKLILGIFVFGAVVYGVYIVFQNSIGEFIKNAGTNSSELILSLIK